MNALEKVLGSYSRRAMAVLALAAATSPFLAQAGGLHDSYYRGKKVDAPAVPGSPAFPGVQESSSADPNGLEKKALQVAKMICADASSAKFDDMYAGSSKWRGVARFGEKIVPVDIYKVEVRLPRANPTIPDLRGEYISLQSLDHQHNALILGRGPTLTRATEVAIDEKAGTLYLQAYPGKTFIPIEALRKGEKPDIKTVIIPRDKSGKSKSEKVALNPHPSLETQLRVNPTIYFGDTWGYANTRAGELDFIGTKGDLAEQVGSLQVGTIDIWKLKNFNPIYSLMLDNAAADLGGLEISSDRRIEAASDRSMGLPVPVPTP